MNTSEKRIGLFGGTFSPPHIAHSIVAESVREQLHCRKMLFVYGYVCPPPLTGSGISTVRQAQHDIDQQSGMALSVNRAFVVQTDDLNRRANDRNTNYPQDQLHFGTDGIWLLGVRMAQIINAH